MEQKIKKLWREFIPFLIVYALFDIVIVGSLFVCAHGAKETGESIFSACIDGFIQNITNFKFITAIGLDFFGFIKWSFWTLVITIILFIAWKIKFAKESEYDGIESGSSDWANACHDTVRQP